ncbi:MAG: PmoA family protein [Planctomycetes bacterium]|nr:PmoA family protein [Planctomycetota bacterium]MCH9724059.1 PmoA family protein [Planctomycetota bacterium]MCH9778115.1 PmoA family protein [Planctomycetota bacterium]MCH9790204.1 PmoA family protein [Planctomycetota bacterium]
MLPIQAMQQNTFNANIVMAGRSNKKLHYVGKTVIKMKQTMIFSFVITLVTLMGNLSLSWAGPAVILEVFAGKQARHNCVVSIPVPKLMESQKNFSLVRIDNGTEIPIQLDVTGNRRELVWILRERLDKGETRQYRLLAEPGKTGQADRVTVVDDGKHLNVKVGGKPVLTYNYDIVEAPQRDQDYYDKSGYIHPLYTPSGKVITDDFNPDHAHQHGIMFSWRKVLFEGRENNGWDQKSKLGKVEHQKVNTFASGPVFGLLTTTINHVDLTNKTGPVTMLDEVWRVRVFALDDQFLFDINSIQNCATKQPVTIDKVHYGGMTIRGHADWHKDRTYDYLTSEGKNKENGNQTRPHWVEMYGPLAGETAGVTILSHPQNFRFPQPVRLHPKMPYFCFAVAAIDAFAIDPGKPYVSRYRYYVHDGQPDAQVDQRLWEDYADPPEVKIVPES